MIPGLEAFLPSYGQLTALERPIVRWMIRFMEGKDVEDQIVLPCDKPYLSAAGAEALRIWKELCREDKDAIVDDFFPQEKKYSLPDSTIANDAARDVSWLANPLLQNKEALLGALLEDYEDGNRQSKVTMLRQVLARAGKVIDGMHALLGTHMKEPDTFVIQGGKGGRHNVTFSLTEKGLKAARDLREKHLPKNSQKTSSN